MKRWCVAGLLLATMNACGGDGAKPSQHGTLDSDPDISDTEDTGPDVEDDEPGDTDDEDESGDTGDTGDEDDEPGDTGNEPGDTDEEPGDTGDTGDEDDGPGDTDDEPGAPGDTGDAGDEDDESGDTGAPGDTGDEDDEPGAPGDTGDTDDDTGDPGDVDPCPLDDLDANASALIGGRCAYFYDSAVTWPEADAVCHARGMRLIPIRSSDEDAELAAWLGSLSASGTWIGLNDIAEEGTFVWSLGGDLGSEAPLYLPAGLNNGPYWNCVALHVYEPAGWFALTCDYHFRDYTCTFD